MPKIPTLQRQRSLPKSKGGVLMQPGLVGREFDAIIQGGKEIAAVGSTAMRVAGAIAERDKRLERSVTASKIGSDYTDKMSVFKDSLFDDRDYQTFMERFEKQADTYVSEAREATGGDEFLAGIVEKSLGVRRSNDLVWALGKKREIMVREGQGQHLKLYNELIDEWVEGSSEEKEAIKGRYELESTIFVQAGVLKPKEAESYLQQFDDRAYGAYFKKLIDSDPKRAVVELGGREPFSGYDKEKRQSLLRQAKEAARGFEAEQKAGWESHIYNKVGSLTNWDTDAMHDLLLSPEFREKSRIDLAAVKRIDEAVSRLEKVNERRMDNLETGIIDLLADGKFDEAKALAQEESENHKRNPNEGIDSKRYEHWMGEASGGKIAAENRAFVQRNRELPKKLTDFYGAMKEINRTDERMKEILIEDPGKYGFTTAEATTLINFIDKSVQLKDDLRVAEERLGKKRKEEREIVEDEIISVFALRFSVGTLTEDYVRDMAKLRGEEGFREISPETIEHWLGKVEGRDSELFNELHERIVRLDPTIKLGDLTKNALPPSKRTPLVNKFKATVAGALNDAEIAAKEVLRPNVLRVSELGMAMPDPVAPIRWNKVLLALDQWELEFKARGEMWSKAWATEYSKFVAELLGKYRLKASDAQESTRKAIKGYRKEREVLKARGKGEKVEDTRSGKEKYGTLDAYEAKGAR